MPDRFGVRLQCGREATQHAVARLMSEAVIDLLEVIDIDQCQRDRRQHQLGQLAVHVATVVQPGERVRVGQRLECEPLLAFDLDGIDRLEGDGVKLAALGLE